MIALRSPQCRIREFLNPEEVVEVFKFLERMRTGVPVPQGWQPPLDHDPDCPYACMSGDEEEHCTVSCHIYDLIKSAAQREREESRLGGRW